MNRRPHIREFIQAVVGSPGPTEPNQHPAHWTTRLTRWARRRPLWLGFLVALSGSIVCIALVDKPVVLAFKQIEHTDWVAFFRIVTDLGEATHWLILAAAAWVACRVGAGLAMMQETEAWLRRCARSAAFAFTSLAVVGISIPILKILIGRLRPRYLFQNDVYGFEPLTLNLGMIGYPSGHSQTIATAMVVAYCLLPRYDAFYLGLALLVGFSRIAVTAHYPADVIMGLFVGVCGTVLIRQWFERHGTPVRLAPPPRI